MHASERIAEQTADGRSGPGANDAGDVEVRDHGTITTQKWESKLAQNLAQQRASLVHRRLHPIEPPDEIIDAEEALFLARVKDELLSARR